MRLWAIYLRCYPLFVVYAPRPFLFLAQRSSAPRCPASGISVAGVSLRFISPSSISPAFNAGCSFRWHFCRRISQRPLCRILSGFLCPLRPDRIRLSLSIVPDFIRLSLSIVPDFIRLSLSIASGSYPDTALPLFPLSPPHSHSHSAIRLPLADVPASLLPLQEKNRGLKHSKGGDKGVIKG